MIYVKSDDLINFININYRDSDSLSFLHLINYSNTNCHTLYVHNSHAYAIRNTIKNLKEDNWKIECVITSVVLPGVQSTLTGNIFYNSRSVGVTNTIIGAKVYVFIKDKTIEELVSDFKRVIALKAFI